jgi:hypothetical protein
VSREQEEGRDLIERRPVSSTRASAARLLVQTPSAFARLPASAGEHFHLFSVSPTNAQEISMSADKDRGIRREKQKRAKDMKKQARQAADSKRTAPAKPAK